MVKSRQTRAFTEPASLSVSYVEKINMFFRTPLVKFIYNQVLHIRLKKSWSLVSHFPSIFKIFHVLHLVLFTYIMLCDFYPVSKPRQYGNRVTYLNLAIALPEVVLHVWTFTRILEKIGMV